MDSSALQPGQKLLIPPLPKGKTPRRPTPTESTPEVAAAGDTYTIEAGDDRGFWGVAEKAYGDGKYMYLITAANQGVDPDKLQVGQKLVLPPLAEARKAESRLPRLQRPKSVAAGGDGRPLFD